LAFNYSPRQAYCFLLPDFHLPVSSFNFVSWFFFCLLSSHLPSYAFITFYHYDICPYRTANCMTTGSYRFTDRCNVIPSFSISTPFLPNESPILVPNGVKVGSCICTSPHVFTHRTVLPLPISSVTHLNCCIHS
jgi:hypothetical protein